MRIIKLPVNFCAPRVFCLVWFMVFNATFNNISVISWLSVLLVKDHVFDKLTDFNIYSIIFFLSRQADFFFQNLTLGYKIYRKLLMK
jgi:hypothetical protein